MQITGNITSIGRHFGSVKAINAEVKTKLALNSYITHVKFQVTTKKGFYDMPHR